jgi:hypothetical protein
MMETLPPPDIDTRVCSQSATHPEGQGFLATRRPDGLMLVCANVSQRETVSEVTRFVRASKRLNRATKATMDDEQSGPSFHVRLK